VDGKSKAARRSWRSYSFYKKKGRGDWSVTADDRGGEKEYGFKKKMKGN